MKQKYGGEGWRWEEQGRTEMKEEVMKKDNSDGVKE